MPSATDIIHQHMADGQLFLASDVDVEGYTLQRMVDAGELARILRGVYLSAAVERHPLVEEAAVALRTPAAVIGLLSALVYHELTTEWSRGVWVLIPRHMAPPQSSEIDLHALRVTPDAIDPDHDVELGIQTLSIHGVSVRITNPIRTVVDCLRHKRHVRRGVALESLRALRRSPAWDGARFYQLAQRFRVWSKVRLYLEGMG